MVHEGDGKDFDMSAIISEMNTVLVRDKMRWSKRTIMSLTAWKHANALILMYPEEVDREDPHIKHFEDVLEMAKHKSFGLIMPIITTHESWSDTLRLYPEPGPLLEIEKKDLPMIYAVRAGVHGVEPLLKRKYRYPLLQVELEKPQVTLVWFMQKIKEMDEEFEQLIEQEKEREKRK